MHRRFLFGLGVVAKLSKKGGGRVRTRQIGLRLTEEEYARLEAIERRTQRKRQDVLRLLLRQATVSATPDVALERGGQHEQRA